MPRLTRTVLVLAAGAAVLACAGCQDGGGDSPPLTGPSTVGSQCPDGPGQAPAQVGGPLQIPNQHGVTFGRTYIAPGTFQDAGVIELPNKGTAPVRINAVRVVPDPEASPLSFDGAFITPSAGPLEIKPARDRHYEPAEGYCLPPTKGESPPVLVLRFGPASPADAACYTVSRNNSINVDYTTQDGRRYVAAYPYRFEYPNRPN